MATPAEKQVKQVASVELKTVPVKKIKLVRFWQAVHIDNKPVTFINGPGIVEKDALNNVPNGLQIDVIDSGIEIHYTNGYGKKEVVYVSWANIGSIVYLVE